MPSEHQIRNWAEADDGFEAFKRENPGGTYAQYYAHRVCRNLEAGQAHLTLGGKLKFGPGREGTPEYTEKGRIHFAAYSKLLDLKPHDRLIDYGCGSFRIGYHAMNYLDPGNYFGLDITDDFINMGKELIGADMLAARNPRTAVISPESLAEAQAFQADAMISTAVAIHVHPDEAGVYYGNLQRLASKPGARLLFTVHLSNKFQRVGRQGFAWPLQYYKDQLPEMEFVREHKERLLFKRPER